MINEQLKTSRLDTAKDFMDLEEEIQQLLLKYPNLDKIDVVYKPNSISQTKMNEIEKVYEKSRCEIVNSDNGAEEFESYFRLEFPRFGICTWNEINPEMSEADKREEKGIAQFEDDRQSNF